MTSLKKTLDNLENHIRSSNNITKSRKMNIKGVFEYFDLAAIFKLAAVVLFIDLSFTAKVGIVIAIGLFLVHTGYKRYKLKKASSVVSSEVPSKAFKN